MLDLLIRDAKLPDGRTGVSIGIKDGRIVDVAESLDVEAGDQIGVLRGDADGALVRIAVNRLDAAERHHHACAHLGHGHRR